MRADVREIVRGLRAILEDGQVTELRAFAGKRPIAVGYFDTAHVEDMAKAAAALPGASGVYFIPNVIKPALLARAVNKAKRPGEVEATKDHDIERRRWLLIDCDPKRPAGISSTDAEHGAALDRCRVIREALKAAGWPAPIVGDSGNGGHLMYRVDLPADDGGLVERLLAALFARFTDDAVEVDRSVKNPARVWKLYGTAARKGDPTAERPHRLARLLEVPEQLEPVPLALLGALAGPGKAAEPAKVQASTAAARPQTSGGAVGSLSDAERRDKRIRAEVERFDPAIEGSNGDHLTFRHCSVLVREWGLSPEEALEYLRPWNARCSPPWEDADLLKKLRNAKRYGKKIEGTRAAEPPKVQRPAGHRSVSAPGEDTGMPEPPPYLRDVEPPSRSRPPEPPPVPPGDEAASVDAPSSSNGWGIRGLQLRYTPTGTKVQRTGGNLAKILRADVYGRWGVRLSMDEMRQEVLHDSQPIDEGFPDHVQEEIEDTYSVCFGVDDIVRKLREVALRNPVHPVREHLLSLPKWDGTERLAFIPADILGVSESDALVGEYFKRWAVGAVRRVMKPGCKMDVALVFVGRQGKGKSTFWQIMGGDWFSDTPIDLDSKDRFQQLASSWIVELPEIDWQTSTKTAEALKAFLSSRVDRYRPPYAKGVLEVKRSSVCVGSTNRKEFLTDPTGSRRFWPLLVPDDWKIRLDQLREIRDQLWAEAIHLEAGGFAHWLEPELEALREAQAEDFTAPEPWLPMVLGSMEKLRADAIKRGDSAPVAFQLACLFEGMGVPVHQQTHQTQRRITSVLGSLHFSNVLITSELKPRAACIPGSADRVRVWVAPGGFFG